MSTPRKISRRERQAATLYNSAGQITDFPQLHALLDRFGPNSTDAMIAGARACQMPEGPAILWPVYHPNDILKPAGRQLIGTYWSGPGITPGKKGKTFINQRAGGMLFGALERESARTLYIADDPNRALAVHGSTGQPCLSLFSPGGLKGIAETTIRGIAAARLSVVILIKLEHVDAGTACAMQIRFTAPEIKVQIVPFSGDWGEDWLDDLAEKAFLEAEAGPPKFNDFLAGPNLAGGPLGPEPPPIDTPFARSNVIPHMPWRRRTDALERPVLPSLADMQADLRAALPSAIQTAIDGKPVLVMVPPGGGKSHMALEVLLTTRVPVFNEDSEPCGDRPANFLWATATKDLAHKAFQMAGASLIDMEWDGRGVEGLCNRPVATQCLMDRGRSPHQNACMKCEFGVKPEDDEDDERCRFQKNLSEAPFRRGIFGQHGIVGKESTLLKWAADPRDDFQDRDILVIDEGVPTFTQGMVRIDDITAARVAALGIEDHISHLKSRNTKRKTSKTRGDEDEERFTEDDFQKARDWAAAITPHLDTLGGHLIQAAALGEGLRALDPQAWGEFAKIATRIPKAARAAEASALEKVQDIFGDKRVVPLAWITALGRAVQAGTSWVRVGKDGAVTIVYTNPADLWTRYLKKGGLLLDASCTHVDEIVAAGGVVIDLRCAQPNLKIIQYGPLLHGKGDSGASEDGMKRLKAEAKALLDTMGDDPDVVVITHKALAGHIKDDRVRHWGTHKGHNDWKHKRRLILWGLPLMNGGDQIIGYKTHRAAMAARGINLPDWNGERVQEWVEAGEWDIFPAAKLPAVKEARDWLLRQVNADVFQAIGRLRAVWATEPVTVEIHGFLPIVGFGLHVDEIRLESRGRLHNKTRARAIIAQGVADLGEARTRAKLQEYFKKHTGQGISKDQCDKLVAEIKVQALESGVTLHEAARQSCATNSRLLEAGHEPQAIAQAARQLGGLPGVVAVADLLDQCRRAPGAQRAGP
ncbi:MAG: hypothetical protein M0Z36_09975 [Thermaerobacter sp.]|nr:hypothetical protein [Thermaerobacter sp.]